MNRMQRYTEKLKKYCADSSYRFVVNAALGLYNSMPDRDYLERKFEALMGAPLHLDAPQTFNEKLQWLKLYDRKPEYTMMVDKYRVREYITQKIGAEYLIPLLGVWDSPDEIDFAALPEQFVLKCNHNSGLGMCICKDKSRLDLRKVRRELRKGLRQDYYLPGREWPYKDVPRKIIAEKYMVDTDGGDELSDYKVLCFNGVPKLIEVHKGRFGNQHTQDFYDANWDKTAFNQPDMPTSDEVMVKPVFMDEMLALSQVLSQGIPHVRVDWYYANHRLFFGELTFFDGSGFDPFDGEQDLEIGSWLALPEKICYCEVATKSDAD